MVSIKENIEVSNKYSANNAPILEGDVYINLLTWSVEIASKTVEEKWANNLSYNDGTQFFRDVIKKVTLNNQIITYPDAILRVKNHLQSDENKTDVQNGEGTTAFDLTPVLKIAFDFPQLKIIGDLVK